MKIDEFQSLKLNDRVYFNGSACNVTDIDRNRRKILLTKSWERMQDVDLFPNAGKARIRHTAIKKLKDVFPLDIDYYRRYGFSNAVVLTTLKMYGGSFIGTHDDMTDAIGIMSPSHFKLKIHDLFEKKLIKRTCIDGTTYEFKALV